MLVVRDYHSSMLRCLASGYIALRFGLMVCCGGVDAVENVLVLLFASQCRICQFATIYQVCYFGARGHNKYGGVFGGGAHYMFEGL